MAKRVGLWVLIAAVGAWAFWSFRRPAPSVALTNVESVLALAPAPRGVGWARSESFPEIAKAAMGTDPDRLVSLMQEAGVQGVWVAVTPGPSEDPDRPLRERFSRGGIVRGIL